MLAEFEGQFLAVLQRDDPLRFNNAAGLPVAVVVCLQALLQQAVECADEFLLNPALFDVFSYLRSIPDGLIPAFFANQVSMRMALLSAFPLPSGQFK